MLQTFTIKGDRREPDVFEMASRRLLCEGGGEPAVVGLAIQCHFISYGAVDGRAPHIFLKMKMVPM